MELKLTKKAQYSHKDGDGRKRNHLLYFLNGELIFKQKIPFDTNWEKGFDRRTMIYDDYILNGKIYQKRQKWLGCGHPDNDKMEVREVSFPLSKEILKQFNIPENVKIEITTN
jgi:hypothetical protein